MKCIDCSERVNVLVQLRVFPKIALEIAEEIEIAEWVRVLFSRFLPNVVRPILIFMNLLKMRFESTTIDEFPITDEALVLRRVMTEEVL